MKRTSMLLATLMLVALCGGRFDTDNSSGDGTPPPATPAAISYDTFLAALAENGWVPTQAQKEMGSVSKGVEVTVRACSIELKPDKPTAIDYHVTSVNGQPPSFSDEETGAQLGAPNITRSEFEQKLAHAQETGIIDAC